MTHQGLDWQNIFEEMVGLSVVITLGKAKPGKLFFSVKADTTKQTHCHKVCFSVDFRGIQFGLVSLLSQVCRRSRLGTAGCTLNPETPSLSSASTAPSPSCAMGTESWSGNGRGSPLLPHWSTGTVSSSATSLSGTSQATTPGSTRAPTALSRLQSQQRGEPCTSTFQVGDSTSLPVGFHGV